MPQRQPKPRRVDSCGEPLPELRAAETRDLRQHPTNVDAQVYLRARLDALYAEMLRADFYGAFTVHFDIQAGIIQRSSSETITRTRRIA